MIDGLIRLEEEVEELQNMCGFVAIINNRFQEAYEDGWTGEG